jgi:hypothetical protein
MKNVQIKQQLQKCAQEDLVRNCHLNAAMASSSLLSSHQIGVVHGPSDPESEHP